MISNVNKNDIQQQLILFLLCARWVENAIEKAHVLSKKLPVNWPDFYLQVKRNSLAPLIYTIIKKKNLLPEDLEVKLLDDYNQNRIRNIYLYDELMP